MQVSREVPARAASCSWVRAICGYRPPGRSGLAGGWAVVRVVRAGGGDALGDGLEDAVGQPLFEVGEPLAQDRGDTGGDPRVGEQQPVDVVAAHDADGDVVEGFGVVVVHVLSEQDHLAEDGARCDDRNGERAAVGGDAEDVDAALLEDEQDLAGLGRRVQDFAGAVGLHRRGGGDGLHLPLVQVAEDVDLGHAPGLLVVTGVVHVVWFLASSRCPGRGRGAPRRAGQRIGAARQTVGHRHAVVVRPVRRCPRPWSLGSGY